MHGLHPYDVPTRVEQALEGVRPYLGSHGGDVELLEVTDDGAVRLRLLGSCDGCPSSAVTLELAVQDAIEAAAPEVVAIEVETPATRAGTRPARPSIPVDALRSRLDQRRHLAPAAAAAALSAGRRPSRRSAARRVLVCRVGSDVFAFRNHCARCEGDLDGAVPERRLGGAAGDAVLACPACGAHYDVRRAGAGLDEPGLHLDPLPVLVAGGVVRSRCPRR